MRCRCCFRRCRASWRQLYKNRSSRKIDSQRLFSREFDFGKTFSFTEISFVGRPIFIQFIPEVQVQDGARVRRVDDVEVVALAVHVPKEYLSVEACRGEDVPLWMELGGVDLPGVAGEEHDGGLHVGGARRGGPGRLHDLVPLLRGEHHLVELLPLGGLHEGSGALRGQRALLGHRVLPY